MVAQCLWVVCHILNSHFVEAEMTSIPLTRTHIYCCLSSPLLLPLSLSLDSYLFSPSLLPFLSFSLLHSSLLLPPPSHFFLSLFHPVTSLFLLFPLPLSKAHKVIDIEQLFRRAAICCNVSVSLAPLVCTLWGSKVMQGKSGHSGRLYWDPRCIQKNTL